MKAKGLGGAEWRQVWPANCFAYVHESLGNGVPAGQGAMKPMFLLSVFLFGSFTVVASAQVDNLPGVARISLVHGDVSTQRGDTGDWVVAALNQPVVAGDKVSTGDPSQAELQLDHANILRLGNNAQARIATLERTQIQVQIGQGLAFFTVFKDSDAQVEIDTPNVAIRPTSKEGVYRIEVNGSETQVIVREGEADISTPQGSTRVEKGQAATVRGTADEAGYVLAGSPAKDSWDSWTNERDRVIRNAQSWNNTNRYYVGSENLDANGRWVNVPDYGLVWSPVVAAGWAPYRDGRWVWEPYWGWTWVSNEPWGWAPYHYGRWFLYGSSWMWWPGAVDGNYRPVWAPAYVSFFGFGGHLGASVAFGSVGWLPIGPCDRFFPWYGEYGSRFTVVNVTNISNINRGVGGVAPLHDGNRFSNLRLAARNERVRQSISAVPVNRFGTGRTAPTAVSREAFRDGRMMTGNLPIVPTREGLSGNDRRASASMLRGNQPERFFTKKPPAASPQSLDKQAAQVQEAIQGHGQFIPIRAGAQLDPAGKVRPMPSRNSMEGTVQPARNAQSGRRSKSRPGRASRAATSSRTPKARTTRRTATAAHGSRGATARAASKPARDPRTSTPARVPRPKERSTRRVTTMARGSHGASAHTTQSYLESADRQMDNGDYTAAIASSKHALQVDGNNTAAKARLQRARRAMQAENEIASNRR